ncbi:hypothetical protein [Reyranella sp.]|uniref:hypothetical protein n=1 Tax=Reyranella sp. TaxID=1929291 RepID=UPI003D0C30C4
MAVRKSTMITELDAHTIQGTEKFGGALHRIAANGAKAAGESTNDIYPVLRLFTGWVINSLTLQTAAWGTSGVVEIGCYDTAENGGAVIDADVFASAVDVSAALAKIDLVMEATTQAPDKVNTKLRDLLGMSASAADKWVDVCLTATNIGASQAAKFALTATYTGHA